MILDNKTYISEGHYRDNKGNEYMSIWTFKRKNNINSGDNYSDAKNISCSDKFWAPFNLSDQFKEGYIYHVNCLRVFYNL